MAATANPDNRGMATRQRIRFTKMQGAGNDFVVLDETRQPLNLSRAQYRFLADRHFGVGADQILTVRPAPNPDVDFEYVIHNADGGEVEQCGNGSRCFVRYVVDHGLTDKRRIRVQTRGGVIAPALGDDGEVTVDMGQPVFELARVPFDASQARREPSGSWEKWALGGTGTGLLATVSVALVSMGNPHAVLIVDDSEAAPVASLGPAVQQHPGFVQGVNVGFLQVLAPDHVRLRVYERGAGETLACGSGACAAVVAGTRLGLLRGPVRVDTHGGVLHIDWAGGDAPVRMRGPAVSVFEGEIDIPELE